MLISHRDRWSRGWTGVLQQVLICGSAADSSMQMGSKAVDSLVTIGRGQRESIIGDRQTGGRVTRTAAGKTGPEALPIWLGVLCKRIRQGWLSFGAACPMQSMLIPGQMPDSVGLEHALGKYFGSTSQS